MPDASSPLDKPITIDQGRLTGTGSSDVRRYLGIPYGHVSGERRFAAPQPDEGWSGIRSSTDFGPKAMQKSGPLGGGIRHPMSEDCLTVNVWAPRAPGPHAVLVWLHGGGQIMDGPANRIYDGARLAARGTVVVTIAHRLGPFGFLRLRHLLGDQFAGSENNTLRDIGLALSWVQHNIAAFGGDPARVTLAGESAGAKNVANCLAIPASRSLLRGAISESGSGMTLMGPDRAEEVTRVLMDRLNIADADAEQLLALDASHIVAAAGQLAGAGVNFPWRAVIDGTVMTTDVGAAAAAGELRDVALLVGTNADEYELFALGRKLSRQDPVIAQATHLDDATVLQTQLEAYRDLYGDEMTPRQARIRLMSAEEYWIPSVRMAEAQNEGGGKSWMYRFDWAPRRHPLGLHASHGMEVPFVFGTLTSANARAFTMRAGRAERILSERVQRAWTSFVNGHSPSSEPTWSPYGSSRAVMTINRTWQMCHDPRSAERQLWSAVL